MNEEEAKIKWCPIAQISCNVCQQDTPIQTCVGSTCMMWRWIYRTAAQSAADYDRYVEDGKMIEKCGYCGFGGKP
jgi:hypothetical protein